MNNQENQRFADCLVKGLASELALHAIEGTKQLDEFLSPRIVDVQVTFGRGKFSGSGIRGYEISVTYRTEEVFIEQKSDTSFAKITVYAMDALDEDEATGTTTLGEKLSEVLWNYVTKNWETLA